jgi:2-methylisocitrate lyase-like PEP mutase family enzyme
MLPSNLTGRREAFRKLHEIGCFVIPNPWDIGSARYLRHLGFSALATTSAGIAFSHGLPDTAVRRDDMLRYIGEIVAAVDLPVNADFESGYASDPEGVAANVRLCVDTGVAGLSIEDSTGERENPLYELSRAVERIEAAHSAIVDSSTGVLLTGRAECYLVRHPDPLKESVRRLQAYAEAGADVLSAPGVYLPEEIRIIVSELAPKPVNVIVGWNTPVTVSDLAELGVRRISVGSALARVAWALSCERRRRCRKKAVSAVSRGWRLSLRSTTSSAGIIDRVCSPGALARVRISRL